MQEEVRRRSIYQAGGVGKVTSSTSSTGPLSPSASRPQSQECVLRSGFEGGWIGCAARLAKIYLHDAEGVRTYAVIRAARFPGCRLLVLPVSAEGPQAKPQATCRQLSLRTNAISWSEVIGRAKA